jgi:ABC-2 type transport system ATP-binding protein
MEHPRTFVISSHNLSELDTVLSQMVLLHKGSLLFYEDMDTVREMLFCADGSNEVVRSFAASLPEDVLVQTRLGEVRSRVVAKGSTMSSFAQQAQSMGLAVSAVTPEDVCVYLTGENREEQVNELWA